MESLFAAIETKEPQAEPWFMKADIPPIKPFEQVLAEVEEMNRQYREQTQGNKPWHERATATDYTVEECVRNLKFAGQRILTLPFDCKRVPMEKVLFEIRKETRLIYPKNRGKYMDDNGYPRTYDYLYLINGRDIDKLAPPAPRALVKVENAEIVELVDENDRPIWEYNPDGTRYRKLAIEYTLGYVVRSNNLKIK